jgi:hypothetical protein
MSNVAGVSAVMLDTFRQLIVAQYEAALSTLKACVDRCPDALWNARVANYKFCQVAFHTLLFTDFYLGSDPESFRSQPFHLNNEGFFRDYEEFEDRAPVHLYEKEQILAYLAHCREKAREVIPKETADTLSAPNRFRPRPSSRAELHVYNIRHIQHHSAQLILRLRLDTGDGIPWMSSGWREMASPPAPA